MHINPVKTRRTRARNGRHHIGPANNLRWSLVVASCFTAILISGCCYVPGGRCRDTGLLDLDLLVEEFKTRSPVARRMREVSRTGLPTVNA